MAVLNIKFFKDLDDYPILYGFVWPIIFYPFILIGLVIIFHYSLSDFFLGLLILIGLVMQIIYLVFGLILTKRYTYLISLIIIFLYYGLGFYISINMNMNMN